MGYRTILNNGKVLLNGGKMISNTFTPTTEFISSWKTDNPGVSNSNEIKLPLYSGGTYNFDVNWGDTTTSTITAYDQAEVTHTYPTGGTYEVKISGTLTGWSFGSSGDKYKIINISNWGILNVGNLGNQFSDCYLMTCTATDVMNTSGITNMSDMFSFCSLFNGNIGNLDVSNVTNMYSMFRSCHVFNQDLSGWDVSNVTDMSYMFYDCQNFNGNIGNWNVRNVLVNMSNMFMDCSVFNQDLSGWDVSNVTDMSSMFINCSIFNQNLSGWDVSNVTNMYSMFTNCSEFNSDITSWNVSNVTDMSYMFYNCPVFNQDLNSWNVSKVIDMSYMFYSCFVFNQNLNSWIVSGVTDMSYMFYDCQNFNGNITSWNVSNVIDMYSMFEGCFVFNQNLNSWIVSGVTNMSYMFYDCQNFNGNITSWNVSNVIDMYSMFEGCLVFNQDLSSWNVSNVNNMISMFKNTSLSTTNYSNILIGWALLTVQPNVTLDATSSYYNSSAITARAILTGATNNWTINDLGLAIEFVSSWKTDNTGVSNSNQIQLPLYSGGTYNFDVNWGDTTISTITAYDQAEVTHTYPTGGTYEVKISGTLIGWRFNYEGGDHEKIINISNWGILNVGNLGYQFASCINMTCTATDPMDTSGITNMSHIFYDCQNFNGNITSWNVSNVIDMSYMFYNCLLFNQDLNSWIVSGVTDMNYMFFNCFVFNQNLNSWNVSNVIDMHDMFDGCLLFNQDLNSWIVSGVTDMNYMFYDCQTFNGNITSWNVSSVIDMTNMFYNCLAFNQDLNSWNVSNVIDMYGMFNGCSVFNQNLNSWNVSNVTSMSYMFDNTSLSTTNYSNILIGWSLLTVKPDVVLGASSSYYNSSAITSRAILTGATNNWTINDLGLLITGSTLSTTSVSNITTTGMTSGGNITSDGGASVTARGVCYSTSQNPTTSDTHTHDGSGTGSFTSTLTGLTSGTTYYIKAYATNSHSTTYGSQVVGTTSSILSSGQYLIDFGYDGYETSGNWNNLNTTIWDTQPFTFTNLIDSSGVTSNISLSVSGFNADQYYPTLSTSGIYPINAMRDYYGNSSSQNGYITINGLNQNKIYDIYLFNYVDSSGSTPLTSIYTIVDKNGSSQYILSPFLNLTKEIISPDRIPTSDSIIYVTVSVSGITSAGISVMKIVEKTPVTYDSSSIQKVLLTFNTIPTSTGITKAALKYDKRFAFSYVCDDNMIDQYTYGFPYLNGGTAADTVYYSGKTYTDGCGNKIKFNMGLSITSFNGNAPYPGSDVHVPVYTGNIQWSQYPEMCNAGWAITSHSLTHSDYNNSYDIERNRSYVYLQTSGKTIKIFTQPSNYQNYGTNVWAITGNTKYIAYQNGNDWQWFANGSLAIPAGRVDNVDYTDGSNRISYASWPVKNFNMYRTSCLSSAEIQTQIGNLLKATGTTSHTWKSFLTHSVAGNGGGFGSFSDFRTGMDYIEDNHGSDGADNCWMVNDQDVYEYLVARDTTIISQVANQNTLELTFDWANTNSGNTLPDDMRKYCLSLLVSGNTSISDIIIYGGTGSTYNKSYKTNTALVNLNWNGGISEAARLLRVATERVEIAEATTTANDISIAQDYVSAMSSGTDKTNLQNRLNAI